jgi:hypothetical protein
MFIARNAHYMKELTVLMDAQIVLESKVKHSLPLAPPPLLQMSPANDNL